MSFPPAKRPPVIIIGAHRSGTTATARALALLGLQLGQRLDSHYESKAIQQLHDHYLERVGAAWHKPHAFLEWIESAEGKDDCVAYLQDHAQREFNPLFGYRTNLKGWWLRARLRSGCAWGWKEPRTTLFAPLWLQIFPDALFLEVVRHPVAVALSIRQRELKFRAAGDVPHPGLDQMDYCLGLALTYVEAGGQMEHRTRNYRRVRFEALQADAINTLEELAQACGLRPTQVQLDNAARSIRPALASPWNGLSDQEILLLPPREKSINALGYKLPSKKTI